MPIDHTSGSAALGTTTRTFGGGVPPPQPIPPMPPTDVPGIELPDEEPDHPHPPQPPLPHNPDIDDPVPHPGIPVREPPGTPAPAQAGALRQC